jgi:hypothetical protein
MSKNLIEGLQEEQERVRKLIDAYSNIGSAGEFAKIMMEAALTNSYNAIGSMDTLEMVAALKELQECE